ncbi:two-partner secretion domain-containing protein [Pseudomonas sp. KNUC1026]|uniref:two-partner secretion domain-containing protein n=1 Tax=Pseudomonas sp. KNUC1026 TaxID=2893890 RepID=UPI001F445B66|nr:filamentous hemagglutinin N-terminal domain-containing protein [Pseudomonas sp. KNUC1026]UFH49552.1 filamentous hemagglutinin N-terminal domain-containing protein [Pseudomonas sp. KNUC1026]
MDAFPRQATFWGLPTRGIALLLINALFWQPIWAQAATGIVVSNSATQVGQAGNGVPVVNIAAPNASGLSHNQYQAYNVGQEGVILNNATGNVQATQLGGIIVGNANLQGRAASTILNEVNGGSPSQLNGYTEVAGQAARVIVANHYGVTCNGCGFINTPRATLTTGKPVLDGNGKLDHYQVDGGQVSIEGTGLDASNIDQFEIITRSAKINGEIHARKLALVTGKNDVDAESLNATARAADGNAPALAVDASALGGMYANTIRLVGTEAGVGVKLDGNLAASAGDIQLDANGHLSVAQAAASGNIDAHGRSVELNGPAYAAGNVNARADNALVNRGTLAAAGNINLTAGGTLSNGSTVEAGVNPDNSRNATADVVLRAGEIANSGKVIASRDLDAQATGTLRNTGALSATGQARAKAATLDNSQGKLLAGGNLTAEAGTFSNQNGQVITDANLAVTAAAQNNQAGLLSGRKGVTLSGQDLDNRQGGTVSSREGNLSATFAGKLDNREEGALAAGGTLEATARQLDNRRGTVEAQGPVTLGLAGDSQNDGGSIYSATSLNIDSSGHALNNQGGNLKSAGSLGLLAGSFDNSQGGSVASAGLLSLLIAGQLNNRGGLLYSQSAGVGIEAGELANQGGTAQGETLSLTGTTAHNQGGNLIARSGAALVTVGAFDNGTGTLAAQGLLKIVGDSFANHGQVAAHDIDTQLTGTFDNHSGVVESAGNLDLAAAGLDNANGQLRALGDGTSSVSRFSLAGALNNQNGNLETAANRLEVTAAGLSNDGGKVLHLGGGAFGLSAALLQDAGGTLATNGSLLIEADQWSNSSALQARDLTVRVKRLTQATTGKLIASGTFTGSGDDWANAGTLASNGAFSLDLSRSFTNAGRLISGAGLNLGAGSVLNQGTLAANDTLSLTASGITNDKGLLTSGGNMQLLADTFTNHEADVYSLGDLLIARDASGTRASLILNQSGNLTSDGAMALAADTVRNERTVLAVDPSRPWKGLITEIDCNYPGGLDCSGSRREHVWRIDQYDRQTVSEASAASSMTAGGSMGIQADTFTNSSSSVATGGDFIARVGAFNNQGVVTGETLTSRIVRSGRKTSYGAASAQAQAFNDRYSENGSAFDPNDSSGYAQGLAGFYYEGEYFNYKTSSELSHDAQTYGAVIQAAGRVDVQASNGIDNSVVKPGYLFVSPGTPTGTHNPAGVYGVQVAVNSQLPPDLAQQQVNPTTLPGFSLPGSGNGLFHLSDQAAGNQAPAGAGSVTTAANPNIPHRYLIETNPALTDLRQFMSSDYLLGLLGYNPDSNWKRLGDGLYEQRLVQQAVIARTGQRFIDGMASDEAQFKYLMDNAIASKAALDLSVGVSLTSEQVAALTHDIVWMEDQVVNGQHVLVPVLYLAQAEGRLRPSVLLSRAVIWP